MRYPSRWMRTWAVASTVALALLTLAVGCGGDDSADACRDVSCVSPPADQCDGNAVVSYQSTGTCMPSGDCSYQEAQRQTCSGQTPFCFEGSCTAQDPCEGVTCGADDVPETSCEDGQRVSYDPSSGQCANGICRYEEAGRQPCSNSDVGDVGVDGDDGRDSSVDDLACADFEPSANPQAFGLFVDEPTGVDRSAQPTTIGVPLQRGSVSGADDVILTDGDQLIPTQNRLLSRFPDGSAQFVLLDFQTDLAAGERHEFTVRPNESADCDGGMHVDQTNDDTIVVDTGPLKVEVARDGSQGFNPIRRMWIDDSLVKQADDACSLNLDYETTQPERPYTAEIRNMPIEIKRDGSVSMEQDPMRFDYIWMRQSNGGPRVEHVVDPASVTAEVEESGPLRSVVTVRGRLMQQDDPSVKIGDFTLRFHFYAGKPYFRLQHTFVFSYDVNQTYLSSLELEIPVRLGDGSKYVARPAESDVFGDLSDDTDMVLYTEGNPDPFDEDNNADDINRPTYVADVDADTVDDGQMAHGWVGVDGASGGVGIGVRNFADLYPASLEVHGQDDGTSALVFGFWSDHNHQVLHHGETADPDETSGTAITHEAVVMLEPPGSDAAATADAFAARYKRFSDPIYPFSDPEYVFNEVDTFSDIPPSRPGNEEGFDKGMALKLSLESRAITRKNMTGVMNFGSTPKKWMNKTDWQHGQSTGWYAGIRRYVKYDPYEGWEHHNIYIDSMILLQAMRTGYYPYRRLAARKWAHNMNVSTIQWAANEDAPLGFGMRHGAYQWGTQRRTTGGAQNGHRVYGSDPMDAWLEYNLSGDWRTLDGLSTYATMYLAADTIEESSETHRNPWSQAATMLPLFALIPDLPDREAVAAKADEITDDLFVETDDGYQFPWAGDFGSLRSDSRMPLLWLYYHVTQDERMADAYSSWAAFVHRFFWNWDGSKWTWQGGSRATTYASVFAFAYRLDQDPRFLQFVKSVMPPFQPGDQGPGPRPASWFDQYQDQDMAELFAWPEGLGYPGNQQEFGLTGSWSQHVHQKAYPMLFALNIYGQTDNDEPDIDAMGPDPSSLTPGDGFSWTVDASDSDGSIDRVEFGLRHDGGPQVDLGSDTTEPYSISVSSADFSEAGDYEFSSRAVDDQGATWMVNAYVTCTDTGCSEID